MPQIISELPEFNSEHSDSNSGNSDRFCICQNFQKALRYQSKRTSNPGGLAMAEKKYVPPPIDLEQVEPQERIFFDGVSTPEERGEKLQNFMGQLLDSYKK